MLQGSMSPSVNRAVLLAASSLLWGCAHAPEPQVPTATEAEAASAPADPTVGLNVACASTNDCHAGQECVPFADNSGEAGLCGIVCQTDKDCPGAFFCGHNAVNSLVDICYRRLGEPKAKPANARPAPASEPDAGSLDLF
jgi:hypothetical protein